MTLVFTVPGNTVGKNQARGIDFERRRVFVTSEMKRWQRKVASAAWAAAIEKGWPDAFMVGRASLHVQHYNVRGDFDRGNEYLADALQVRRWWTPRGESPLPGPVGLIENDRDLFGDGSPMTIEDGDGPRTVVTVTLRALRAPHEADDLRRRWYEREARRAAKKATPLVKREEVRGAAKHRQKRDELAEIESRLGLRLL